MGRGFRNEYVPLSPGGCHADAEAVKPPCLWAFVCRISGSWCCFWMRGEMFLRKVSHFPPPRYLQGGGEGYLLGLHKEG
ncbi:hypothetical protein CGRA01v4_07823 [Colletotrichum graminicola]|nr:hypothetical protein CGRA01v4_07823 [Colletotrichum graminicola]